MEMEQKLEWDEAQKIVISLDLVAAAKQQLYFLGEVDRNRWLYEGPGLDKAITRYNSYWLPLLAKHSKSPFFGGPIVVPLDCEWVWHCHRLNPLRYNSDCKALFGTILDNQHVVSSTKGAPKGETEKLWKQLFPSEPFDLDLATSVLAHDDVDPSKASSDQHMKLSHTDYDLVSAVKRQSSFFNKVSRPHMYNELYLEGAVSRYKGFLHLIKRNKPLNCVPTYDIDLIWHTHQLHPISYCKDLRGLLGRVVGHDDSDSDRTKGSKLDIGFSNTTRCWEEKYGCRYWRAGAVYRPNPPPLPLSHLFNPISAPAFTNTKGVVASHDKDQTLLHLPETKSLEVMLEFVGLRNVPAEEEHRRSLFLTFGKEQPDRIIKPKGRLNVSSSPPAGDISEEKQVAYFQCEPSGSLMFQLMSESHNDSLPLSHEPLHVKTMGSFSVSVGELLSTTSNSNNNSLFLEKWFELETLSSNSSISKPIFLRIAISVTIPTKAPYVLHMIPASPQPPSHSSIRNCSLFPPTIAKEHNWTRVTDVVGDEIISLQFSEPMEKSDSLLKGQVIALTKYGERCTLAELRGTEWSLTNVEWSIYFPKAIDDDKDDGHLLQLTSASRMVKYFQGRRLDYYHHPKNGEKETSENEIMTAVEFSVEYPYGKAVAMVDLKVGIVNVKEEWLLMPGMVIAFLFYNILRVEEGRYNYDEDKWSSEDDDAEGNGIQNEVVISSKRAEWTTDCKDCTTSCHGSGCAKDCDTGTS
ncbi:unnamed protein product [Cuscuta epithymum]|uniref:Glycine-rich domain-containing protein 1 n=1 Tax=Cuscuta epithymum TaxID=186058 RepID=A0AAV0EFK1_9ASTE|nr:unnamed protein product [Cuscuta epithymum]